jgi:hypothetical protein
MSRIITLITALGAAVLVAVPAAWGAPEPDARSDGMNRLYGLGEYSPEARAETLRSEGLNKLYGLGEWATTTPRSIEVRERAMSIGREDPTTAMLDAREQALVEKRTAVLSIGTMPDVFERAVAARGTGSLDHFVANDNRFRPGHVDRPVEVTVTGSGDEIAWPQVGIGFGIGVALILGLLLAVRTTRQRPLAH